MEPQSIEKHIKNNEQQSLIKFAHKNRLKQKKKKIRKQNAFR